MDYSANADVAPQKGRPVLKVVACLVAALLLFGAGVFVGRQNPSQKNNQASLDYSSVDRLYSVLKENYDGTIDDSKLLDGVKHGLVGATGDPYTTYFNPDEAKSFQEQLTGSFSGIGAELGAEGNKIVIVSPLAGYPAQKAGLKPKDVVAAIDGKPTTGMTVDQAVAKIRGPAGTKVKLTIIRGSAAPFEVPITRDTIHIDSVKSSIEDSIGYLRISQFSDDTVNLAKKAAQNFKDKGVKAVVLDLRGNPGGYLNSAVDISSLWLDNGKVVVKEKRGGKVTDTKQAVGGNILKGLPTVVLIDAGSASASEIMAGALRDHGVATLMGEKSFGKGSVQEVECLEGTKLTGACEGAELKVTVARWFTPKDQNIDKQGISPDIKIVLKSGNDNQKAKALEFLKQKIH